MNTRSPKIRQCPVKQPIPDEAIHNEAARSPRLNHYTDTVILNIKSFSWRSRFPFTTHFILTTNNDLRPARRVIWQSQTYLTDDVCRLQIFNVSTALNWFYKNKNIYFQAVIKVITKPGFITFITLNSRQKQKYFCIQSHNVIANEGKSKLKEKSCNLRANERKVKKNVIFGIKSQQFSMMVFYILGI